jgi:hypothetical protein
MHKPHTKRLTLIACILGSDVVFIDGTVVSVAFPSIREDLNSALAAQQWIVEAHLLTLGALLLVGGSPGDLFGRGKIFSASPYASMRLCGMWIGRRIRCQRRPRTVSARRLGDDGCQQGRPPVRRVGELRRFLLRESTARSPPARRSRRRG